MVEELCGYSIGGSFMHLLSVGYNLISDFMY